MKVVVDLHIQFMENGDVAINGPIANKPMCLGILDIAKKAVMDFQPTPGSPLLKPPPNGFSPH